METENDDNVFDYSRLPTENCRVKFKNYDSLEGDNDLKHTLSCHLDAFIFSNSKRNMTTFIGEIKEFYKNSIYYGDTNSFYIEKNYWDVLDWDVYLLVFNARVNMITIPEANFTV